MKATGYKIRPKEKENIAMLKEIFMLVILDRTKLVVLEFIPMLMEVDMKENGSMMFSKVKEKRLGSMELSMLVNIKMV